MDLRATVQRLRGWKPGEPELVKIVADVDVSTEDQIWKAYEGENAMAIQKAIMGRLKKARIIRGEVQRKERLLRFIAVDRGPTQEGWLDFWSELLGVNVLRVHRWDATRNKKKPR